MTTKFPFKPVEEWARRIEAGLVYTELRSGSTEEILKLNQQVYHHNPAVVEPTVPDETQIIEETNDYLVVYKPAPMPMHPGGRYNKNSLTFVLEEMGYPDLRLTHRLDAVTSGLVLFAKTKEFAKAATKAFADGEVEKAYLAMVEGNPTEDAFEIQSKIRRKQGFVFESGKELDSGFYAHTKFQVLERHVHSTLMKCKPITGRTHQIRLHLLEAGFPIIDDPIYGPKGDRSSSKTQNVGISLISVKLGIPSLNIDLDLTR